MPWRLKGCSVRGPERADSMLRVVKAVKALEVSVHGRRSPNGRGTTRETDEKHNQSIECHHEGILS